MIVPNSPSGLFLDSKIMAKLKPILYIKESREELKKVSWPTRQTTVRYTLIVVGACLVIGFVIGGLDFIFTKGLETLLF